ncbi:alkaline phosphatase family protein [Verrucomicrobiales bacterium BCK34]|nr:alkaline phosphatase family protein [Verrucomicrobiales bacterium BCK34]
MFRTLASSLITLAAILLFAFMILFLWTGSQKVEFKRVGFEGDRSTVAIVEEIRLKKLRAKEAATETVEMPVADTAPAAGSGDGPPVVLWVSIPGFRGDYIEKAETPFFDELASEGGSTNKMRPSFPCLTYPAHTTMATGVTPDKHGITADRIRTGPGEVVVSPTDDALLLAEPIWKTATRQGMKTLVHDWPLSQNQTGENVAAHFLDAYNPDATDEERLNLALEQWRAASEGDDKLRLVMLRLNGVLDAGIVHGPRADDTYAAVGAVDAALKKFVDTVRGEWEKLAPANANLIVLVTTDHGLAEVDKNVNIEHLLGEEMMKNADIVAHNAIANLFFKDLPENEGESKIFIDKFDGELSKRIYFRTIKKEELPEEWAYQGDRSGDRVLVLKTGYSFSDEKSEEPVFDPADAGGNFGGYGYPVGESIRMSGQVLISGFPKSPASGTLGEIGQLSFHATVCKLLGIEPAEGAVTETLDVK